MAPAAGASTVHRVTWYSYSQSAMCTVHYNTHDSLAPFPRRYGGTCVHKRHKELWHEQFSGRSCNLSSLWSRGYKVRLT